MSNKKNSPKKIDISIRFSLPHGLQTPFSLSISPDGDISLKDANACSAFPLSMDRTTHFDRPKGKKVQTYRKIEGGFTSINGLVELSLFDDFFVIDTNTKEVGGEPVSVACFVRCRLRAEDKKYRLECEPRLNIFEFYGAKHDHELLAILRVANDVIRSCGESTVGRWAIVTDCALGLHDAINDRTSSLYGSHNLPEGFQLMYASSDTGSEILKGLMKFCDQQSNLHFKKLEKGEGIPIGALTPLLPEDLSVKYVFGYLEGLEIASNPLFSGMKIPEGTEVLLYRCAKE